MDTRFFSFIIAGCVSVMTLTACGQKSDKPVEEIPEIEVTTVVTDSVMLHKTYPGYLSASTSATVEALVDGRLLAKTYQAGDWVEKGRVLFKIDPTLYQDEVSKAESALTSAVSARDYALSHYEAVKKALEADAVSKMEMLQAESNLAQAEAGLKECQASLHIAQTNLGYCTVKAPVSGYISDSFVGEGNYVNGSGSPVKMATIYDTTTLSAIFEIEDAQYEKMAGRSGGMEAAMYRSIPLSFRDNLPHDYSADLVYESPSIDKTTGTILLKGTVKNIDNELKDGMYVTISLPYGADPKAILIKDASIGTDQLGKYVYLVNDSDRVEYRHIEVGELYRDSLRIVSKGLKPGDRYVTKALLTVRDGEEVKPVMTK